MGGTIIVTAILAVVIGFAFFGVLKRIKYGSSCCGEKDALPPRVKVKDKNKKNYPFRYLLSVDGMHCSGCVRKIENKFNTNDYMWAKANLEKKEVSLLSKTEIDEKTAAKIVSDAGFTMLSMKINTI